MQTRHLMRIPFMLLLYATIWCAGIAGARGADSLTLAAEGRTPYTIELAAQHSEAEAYAASELADYLRQISGATFPVVQTTTSTPAIVLRTAQSAAISGLTGDAYAITVRDGSVYLTGGSGRAVLYAAYDFLARLGCRWLAPELDIYAGAAEVVPRISRLVYESTPDVVEHPTFAIRKLDTAGARSHDAETLRRIIDWMPKVRYNTLMVSMISGLGRSIRWDDWREELTSELKKRGLMLQVGGHGYQNFLNAEMEGGTLFDEHPEWFGLDENCERSPATRFVFNTADPDAVTYVINNVVDYVREHPEIDIFGFWPPDLARWSACEEQEALGTPAQRHARLVNKLHAALKQAPPDVRLEMIAYADTKRPPSDIAIPPDVLVDFCPVGQNFDVPIYDPSSTNNAIYADALQAWRRAFAGQIALYSYYRKYAWRSLPYLIPHYMQQELQWYAMIPLQGVSSYAEPADWYTYELNHYVLGHLAWNPYTDVDALIDTHLEARYGPAQEVAGVALASLEERFRSRSSLPYSAIDPVAQVAGARAELEGRWAAVKDARASAEGHAEANLERLTLMLEFAVRDLRIEEALASGAPPERIREMVKSLVSFLTAHQDQGVFLVYGRNDLPRYIKHYTRDWQEVAPQAD